MASLELLVHLKAPEVLSTYRKLRVRIPGRLVAVVDDGDLPEGWAAPSLNPVTQEIGDRWLDSGVSVVLCVPSAIVPGESNYVLNPAHPNLEEIEPGTTTEFRYDSRFLKTTR